MSGRIAREFHLKSNGDCKMLDQLLTCGSCKESTAANRKDKRPKLLSCLHSFCMQCIPKLETRLVSNSTQIVCSVCDQLSSKSNLIDNIFETRLSNCALPLPCGGFPECKELREYYCKTCSDYLCKICKDAHFRVKQTKDHDVTYVHMESNVRFVCPKHSSKEFDTYCYMCSTLMCADCLPEHQDHLFTPDLGDVVQTDQSHTLKLFIELAKEKQIEIEKTKESFEPLLKAIKTNYDRAIDQVTKSLDDEINKLKQYKAETIQQIQLLHSKKMSELNQSKKSIDCLRSSVAYTVQLTEYLFGKNREPGLLYIKESLTEQLKHIVRQSSVLGSLGDNVDIVFIINGKPFVDTTAAIVSSTNWSSFSSNTVASSFLSSSSNIHSDSNMKMFNVTNICPTSVPSSSSSLPTTSAENSTVDPAEVISQKYLPPKREVNEIILPTTQTTSFIAESGPVGCPTTVPLLLPFQSTTTDDDMVDLAEIINPNLWSSKYKVNEIRLSPQTTSVTIESGASGSTKGAGNNSKETKPLMIEGDLNMPTESTQPYELLIDMTENDSDADESVLANDHHTNNCIGSLDQLDRDDLAETSNIQGGETTARIKKERIENDPNDDECSVCGIAGVLLCCDGCRNVFHFQCYVPALREEPRTSKWKCGICPDDNSDVITLSSQAKISHGKNNTPIKNRQGLSEHDRKICEKLLLELLCEEARLGVKRDKSEDHERLIMKPMHWNIRRRLDQYHVKHYSSLLDFLRHLKHVISQALKYDGDDQGIVRTAKKLSELFAKRVGQFRPRIELEDISPITDDSNQSEDESDEEQPAHKRVRTSSREDHSFRRKRRSK